MADEREVVVCTKNNAVRFLYRAKSHKKLLATAHRREDVYNRADEPSVTFCERVETRKWADDFFYKKVIA